ncbi:MAG: hypothetical protein PHU48_01235, partial [Candidatus Cloacimonetes bacterium]|nr:hypothetical protein [Candidatus Cloacimonadota bacterium]
MKAKLLITILLILLGTAIFASEDPFDAEEYVRKTQELNQLAERFKAETGFRGNVSYDLNRMCLGYYEGKFADIQITAEADTASFRTAFEQIMDKVLPYTFARREQLSRTRITNMHGIIETYYYQQVNGYRVEGAGKLSIAYESGRNAFAIGNGTVELPDGDVLPVLSYDDAVRIYDENVEDDEAIKNMRKRRPFLGLLYCDVNKGSEPLYRTPDYRLCWTGGYTMTIYIDAVTGRVYKTIDNTMYDYTVNVTAKVMKDADNNGSFAISNVSLDSTWVRALCDSINDSGYTDSSGNYCFLGNTTTDFESYLSSSSGIQVNHNNGNLVMQNSSINNLPNLDFDYSSIQGNPSNLYYHALQFRKVIRNLMDVSGSSSLLDSTSFEPFIQANCTLANDVNGTYTPSASNYGLISITTGNGNYYSTLCHEMTHDIVYRSLQYNRFRVGSTSDIQGGMDEAFSSYFPCAYKNNPKYRTSLYNKDLCDSTLMVKNYQTTEYPNIHIDESLYARYHMRFPLASAWWSLRSNPLFPNSVQGVCGVDT